jgi:hypothetical protein
MSPTTNSLSLLSSLSLLALSPLSPRSLSSRSLSSRSLLSCGAPLPAARSRDARASCASSAPCSACPTAPRSASRSQPHNAHRLRQRTSKHTHTTTHTQTHNTTSTNNKLSARRGKQKSSLTIRFPMPHKQTRFHTGQIGPTSSHLETRPLRCGKML